MTHGEEEEEEEEQILEFEGNARVGPKVINGYEWGETLGRGIGWAPSLIRPITAHTRNSPIGAWGKVRRVIHLATQRPCAVKIFYRSLLQRRLKNGIPLLRQYPRLGGTV